MYKEYWKDKWNNVIGYRSNQFAKKAYELICPTIKEKQLIRLLDLGCGDGRDSLYFAKKGFLFQENLFDVIYAHLSLHYFDDEITLQIFNRLYYCLKPNGMIFVKCKSIEDPLFGKGKKLGENMYLEGHLRHFFDKEFMKMNLNKFKIIKIKKSSSKYHHCKSNFIEAIAIK